MSVSQFMRVEFGSDPVKFPMVRGFAMQAIHNIRKAETE